MPQAGGKEAEVDALTDLLLQSMDSANPDSDVFGENEKDKQRRNIHCHYFS
jgi:hypothetical protein